MFGRFSANMHPRAHPGSLGDLSLMFNAASAKLKQLEVKGQDDESLFEASPLRKSISHCFQSRCFETVLFMTIVCNFLCTIYDTDLRASGDERPVWLGLAFHLFLVFYAIEVSVRLAVYRCAFFDDHLNSFDLLVTASDVITTGLQYIIGNSPSSSAMRVFRVVRIVRVVKAVRSFRELYLMLYSLINTMKAISWAVVMIFMVLTCCSIVAVEIIHPINVEVAATGEYFDCERCSRAFETVMESNLTFIQQILAGDSWGRVSLPIIDHSPWTVLFLLFVLVLVDLGLLNLILTVIVDSANDARAHDYESKLIEKLVEFRKAKEGFCKICEELDTNQSGTLSLDELLEGYDTVPEFANMLAAMDAGRDDLPTVFQILDDDNSGDVTYTEFVDQLQKLKSQDSHTLLVFMKCYLTELRRQTVEMFKFATADYISHDRVNKHGYRWSDAGPFGKGLYYDDRARGRTSTNSTDIKAEGFVHMLDAMRSAQDFISHEDLLKEGCEWRAEKGPLGKGLYIRKDMVGLTRQELDGVSKLVADSPSVTPSTVTAHQVGSGSSLPSGIIEHLVIKCDALDLKLTRILEHILSPSKPHILSDEPKDVSTVSALDKKGNMNLCSSDPSEHFSSRAFMGLCSTPAKLKALPTKADLPPVHAQAELESLQHGITKAVAAIVQDSLQISHARVLELMKNPNFLARMESSGHVGLVNPESIHAGSKFPQAKLLGVRV